MIMMLSGPVAMVTADGFDYFHELSNFVFHKEKE